MGSVRERLGREGLSWEKLGRGLRWAAALVALSTMSATSAQAQFFDWWPDPPTDEEVDAPEVAFFTDQIIVLEDTIRAYVDNVQELAWDLLYILIALELAVSGAMWGLSRTGIDELVYRLAIKILVWGVIFMIIADTGEEGGLFNMEYIERGFRNIAYSVFGSDSGWSGAVYPGDVLEMGFTEAGRIMAQGLTSGWWFVPFSAVMGGVTAIVCLAGFSIVAIRLWIAIINVIFATIVGLIMIGFAGWRGTAALADRYIIWVFSAAIKLFFLDCIIYLASPVMGAMYTEAIDGGLLSSLLGAFMWPVIAMTYVGMALYIPNVAGRMMTENATTGLQRAMSL
jgi:P-type conjugative transfer protein TrbL